MSTYILYLQFCTTLHFSQSFYLFYFTDLSFTRTDPRSLKRSRTDSDIFPALATQQGIFGSRGGVGLMKLRYDPESKTYLMVSVANQKEKKRSFF